MKIRALKAFTVRNSETGDLTSIANGAIAEVSDTLGQSLISDGLAEEYTLISPTGSVDITSNGTFDVAEYASAVVNVPGITPTGSIEITSNGTVNVTNYASAEVNVPGITPTGSIEITSNGTVDVTNYASAAVNVTDDTVLVPLIEGDITSIVIPSSATAINYYAFARCDELTSVEIPSSVEFIGYRAFTGCIALPSITIPSSVRTIGGEVFLDCLELESVTVLRNTPPDLGENVFSNTSSSLTIYVPAESVETYKEATNWSSYESKIQAIQS